MNPVRNFALVVCSFVFLALSAAAQPLPTARPERAGISPERLERVTQYFKKEIAEKRLPGAVMLVARKGRIVYFESLGIQDPATGAPMTKDSIFRIWSMTKPFVTVATMMLAEEGALSLGDPVSKYLPEFAKLEVSVEKTDPETRKASYASAPPARPVTLHDLLRHTSGIPYGQAKDPAVTEAYKKADLEPMDISSAEFAARVAKIPLVHQPGVAFEYGYSTDILGRVVEVVTGMRLTDVLEKRIFAPLRMGSTGFHVPDASKERLAQPFDTVPGTQIAVKLFDPRRKPAMDAGGSGGVSTAGDYARFLQMLLNGGQLEGVRILSPTSVRLMTSDHLSTTTATTSGPGDVTFGTPGYTFGLGFAVRRDGGDASVPGSRGEYHWTGFANTLFFVDPQEQLIAVFMSVGAGGEIRRNHRRAFRQLVYQAITE